jgi:hypothetical protein
VQAYLAITEVVETMDDLLGFVQVSLERDKWGSCLLVARFSFAVFTAACSGAISDWFLEAGLMFHLVGLAHPGEVTSPEFQYGISLITTLTSRVVSGFAYYYSYVPCRLSYSIFGFLKMGSPHQVTHLSHVWDI